MKPTTLILAALFSIPAFAGDESICETRPDSQECLCLPRAMRWAVKSAVDGGWKECADKTPVLDKVYMPAPHSIDYTFHINCAPNKVAKQWVPFTTECTYAGE